MSDPATRSHRSGASGTVEVLGIAGSLRSGSFNRALLRAAAELAPDGMRIRTFDLDEIPMYDRDVEREGDPEPVAALKRAIRDADGVLIATPEYQRSIPGVLKNALDWASRPPRNAPLKRKPAAIVGATPGMSGTARAQDQLRQVLTYNDMPVLTSPAVLIRRAGDKFDADGNLVDEPTRERVRAMLVHFAAWTRFQNGWTPPDD